MASSAVRIFVNKKTEIQCKKGQQFVIEGAPVNGLFFILHGKVKVCCDRIALENTSLCYFSKDLLQQVLKSDPSFTYDLMLFYANELNKSEAKVKSISQMTVRERVIDTLLYLYRKFGNVNGYIDLALSRREYADYAGTTEEQVIRIFSILKKEKLITAKGKRIGCPNIELLKKEISDHNFFLDA